MNIEFIKEINGQNLVLVLSDKVLTTKLKQLDKLGKLAKIIETQPFEAQLGEILHIPDFNDEYENVWLVGAAKAENYIKLGATITRMLMGKNIQSICLLANDLDKKTTGDILSGIMLRDYVFDEYKTFHNKQRLLIESIFVVAQEQLFDNAELEALKFECESVKHVRTLINRAPNELYPATMASEIKEWLVPLGINVRILKGKEIEDMGLLCAVGKASCHEAHVVVMEWLGQNEEAPVAFIGKGVTYDSGGLSIKPSNFMEKMKGDMAGAAIVAAIMANIAKNQYKKNFVGIVGLVENMVSCNSYRPDDVIKSRSGKTVEINNTDAEGRLVLADILDYIQDHYSPSKMIDLATLTGAIVVSLGRCYAGLFSNDDKFAENLILSGNQVLEPLWRMPLNAVFDDAMNSPIADMKNSASGSVGGGSSTAAMFLQRFVKNDTSWVHLDIAGVSFLDIEDYASTIGGSGFGVRLLHNWVRNNL